MFTDLKLVVALVAVGMVLVGALLANAVIDATSRGAARSLGRTSTAAMSIPGHSRVASHTVRPGDTMSSIALRFHLSLSSLEAYNPGQDPNALVAGERLKLH